MNVASRSTTSIHRGRSSMPAWAGPRQRPTMSASRLDPYIVGVLVIDGILLAVLSIFLLPSQLEGVPFPYAVLIAAVGNILLVEAGLRLGYTIRRAAAPIIAWTAVVLLAFLGGPGGSMLLPGHDPRGLYLLIGGLVPVAFWMARESMLDNNTGTTPASQR